MVKKQRIGFTAPLVEGHKGVTPVIVPFDPREVWGVEPVPLDDRREGWLVEGTVQGVAMHGWIGFRWGRYFLIIGPELRAKAKLAVGDAVEVALSSSKSPRALAVAKEQAPLTTAPRAYTRTARRSSPSGRRRS